jgi:hypothetical protein
MRFRISLNDHSPLVTPNYSKKIAGNWPASVFEPNGFIEREFSSAERAIWEIADEFGINPALLKAEAVC